MNFRKGILALAVSGLGLTGIASAQVVCNGGLAAASVATVRAEGTTEVIPTLTLSGCSGTPNTAQLQVTVNSSAGVSNQPTSSSSSATDATAVFFNDTAHPVFGVVSNGAIQFTYSGSVVPGNGAAATIVVSNVRVNASSQPVASTITASIAGTGGIQLQGNGNTNVAVAYTQHAVGSIAVGGYANTAICSLGSTPVPILAAQISNGFFGSFAASSTGKLYLQVTFGNLVSGVNYYVPTSITTTGGGNTLGVFSLTNSTNSTSTLAGGSIGPSSASVGGVYQLPVTSGSGTAIYYISQVAAGQNLTVTIPLYGVATTGATAGTSSASTVTAQVVGPGNGGYDGMAAPNPTPSAVAAGNSVAGTPSITIGNTTFNNGSSGTQGELTTCNTTLLFPYILNTGGYDTGIALTNASSVPGTTVAEAGTCSMTFYGNGAPTTNPYVTASIPAGTVNTFTVSSIASGFQGYAIAVCNFQNGHGFAFITDGYGQPGRGLSQGYLAIITQSNGFTSPNASF
jgi:hypothetical protein